MHLTQKRLAYPIATDCSDFIKLATTQACSSDYESKLDQDLCLQACLMGFGQNFASSS